MEIVLPSDNREKSQVKIPKGASLAEVLDNCSAKVLEAVLMVLRSRPTGTQPSCSQQGEEQSCHNKSPG
jgi:hypothetical protein